MKLKKFFRKRETKVVLTSLLINLVVLYLFNHFFSITSSLIYFGIGIVLVFFAGIFKEFKDQYFLFGLLISLKYNILGLAMGWFSITSLSMAFACVQQGVITWLTSKVIKK